MSIQNTRFPSVSAILFALLSNLLALSDANARLIVLPQHNAIYDTELRVAWLRNANLAGTAAGRFGVDGIAPDGSMNYQTAVQWVKALNAYNEGAGYLGINNWTLPSTPLTDELCSFPTGPNGESFGYNCRNSAMGELYYEALGLQYPNTAVSIPNNTVGPFRNFQPYLYWSATANPPNGYSSFSFNTGYTGANVDVHYMYVLPMIKHKVNRPGVSYHAGHNQLQVSNDGEMVYDSAADVTWLADADLAATEQFGAQCTSDGVQCINPDGSMSHTTAESWISGMNAAGWLGQTNWELPPIEASDPSCKSGFYCTGSPMGELFYNQLGFTQGQSVVLSSGGDVRAFEHVQPYLYWSCSAPDPCLNNPAPAQHFEWSFSFGSGFQGTDLEQNYLYVMVYSPATAATVLTGELSAALETDAELNVLLSQAAAISSGSNDLAKSTALMAFVAQVNARSGKVLTAEQASEFIALAEATAQQNQ